MDCIWLPLVNLYKASPWSNPIKAHFSCGFFTIYSVTEINCPWQLREQNRTEQSYHYSHGRIPKLLYPVPFKLTYHCSKTTQRVTLMQTFKQITATQVTADSRWMIMKNISLTICAMPVLHKSQVRFVNIQLIFFLFGEFDFVRLSLVRMYKIQVKKNPSKP